MTVRGDPLSSSGMFLRYLWGSQKNLSASLDMMSPYFLRPLETLFWCPAECQNQSRGPSFLRSHRDFLINYNHQQLVCSRFFFLLQPHTTSGRNFFLPRSISFFHTEKKLSRQLYSVGPLVLLIWDLANREIQ